MARTCCPDCLDSLVGQSYPNRRGHRRRRRLDRRHARAAGATLPGRATARAAPQPRLRRQRQRRPARRARRGAVPAQQRRPGGRRIGWPPASRHCSTHARASARSPARCCSPIGRTINSAGDLLCRDGAARQRGDGPAGRARLGRAGDGLRREWAALPRTAAPCSPTSASSTKQFFMYLEDVDLAFRAQLRGWGCRVCSRSREQSTTSAAPVAAAPLESFYNGRNLIRLLAKDLPSGLVPRLLPAIARFQARRAREALAAWRGAAARATLRGQLAGLAELPRHLADRPAVQRRRRVSDRGDLRAARARRPREAVPVAGDPRVQRAGAPAVHVERDRDLRLPRADRLRSHRRRQRLARRHLGRRPAGGQSAFPGCACCAPIGAARASRSARACSRRGVRS